MSRRRTIRVVALLGILLIYAAGVITRHRFGIAVVIRIHSAGVLRNVQVEVDPRGNRYALGDLPPGRSARVYVEPFGESSIDMVFTSTEGWQRAQTLAHYVESSYCGEAVATVSSDGSLHTQDDTLRLVYWKSWLEFVL